LSQTSIETQVPSFPGATSHWSPTFLQGPSSCFFGGGQANSNIEAVMNIFTEVRVVTPSS
jgi:hypothetical protein